MASDESPPSIVEPPDGDDLEGENDEPRAPNPQVRAIQATFTDYAVLNPIEHPKWHDYPDLTKAAAQLGVTKKHVGRLARGGSLKRWLCPDRTYRYLPAQVEALSRETKSTELEKLDQDLGAARDVSLAATSMQRLLGQLMQHNESLYGKAMHAVIEQAKILASEGAAYRKRCLDLEQKQTEYLEKYWHMLEALQTQATQRELMVAEAKEEQQTRAFFTQFFMKELGEIAKAWRGGKGAKAAAARAFLDSLSPEQVDALKHTVKEAGWLNDEQLSSLDTFIPEAVRKRASVANGASQEARETAT